MTPIQKLEQEVEILRHKLREVTGEDDVAAYRATFGLSPQQARVLAMLIARAGKHVRTDALYVALFEAADGDGPHPKIISVILHHIRSKIGKDAVESLYGHGYRVTSETAKRLRRQANLEGNMS